MMRTARQASDVCCVCCQQARSYASKASVNPARAKQIKNRGSRGAETASDPRLETMKQILFESEPSEDERIERLEKAVPSLEAHETIERAWQLFKRHERERVQGELARKKEAIDKAVELLKQVSPELYEKSVVHAGTIRNLNQSRAPKSGSRLVNMFPREYKIPTEKPGEVIWDEKWTPAEPAPEKARK